MMKLSRLFENQFDDPAVSAEELRQFAEDFHGKLKKQSENAANAQATAYAALVAAMGPAFAAFDGALSRRETVLAALGGGTIGKDEALQLIRTTVRKREPRVRDKLDGDAAAYAEFFPRGLTEVARVTLAQVPALLDRLIAAATKYEAKTGAELLAEFQGLKTTFDAARSGQVEQKGEVADARRAVAETRAALERELGLAILELAKLHLGEPERAGDFFDQSLLEDPTRSKKDDGDAGAAGAGPK